MKFTAGISKSIQKDMEREFRSLSAGIKDGVNEATDGLKKGIRKQVTNAGMSRKLANTVRGKVYNNDGHNPAGFVYTKAPDIIRAFDTGVSIKPDKGTWLAIPTDNIPKFLGKRKVTPELLLKNPFYRKHMRFVPVDNRTALIVATGIRTSKAKRSSKFIFKESKSKKNRNKDTVLFVLKKQVRIDKRLDTQREAKKWADKLPELIAEAHIRRSETDGT